MILWPLVRVKFVLLASLLLIALTPGLRAQPASAVPFQYRNGLLWIEVFAAGSPRPLRFLVDSGASHSVIDLAAARRCGLRLGRAELVKGVGCETEARHVDGFRAQVAGQPLPSALLALSLDNVSAATGQHIDGLLGADFFRSRIVQIDFAARQLRLLGTCPSPARAFTLPTRNLNQAICVPIAVNGRGSQWVRVDTGCDEALQWVASGMRASGSKRKVSIGVAGASLSFANTDVKIGSQLFSGIRTGLHRREIFPGEDGLLGNGLLSRFRLTFDGVGHRVVFERL